MIPLLPDKALIALPGDMGKPFGASVQERAGEKILCCSVIKSCLTLCDPMNCSTSGFSVLHYLPEFTQIHVQRVSDAIQLHPMPPSSPLAFNLSQHQDLFQ